MRRTEVDWTEALWPPGGFYTESSPLSCVIRINFTRYHYTALLATILLQITWMLFCCHLWCHSFYCCFTLSESSAKVQHQNKFGCVFSWKKSYSFAHNHHDDTVNFILYWPSHFKLWRKEELPKNNGNLECVISKVKKRVCLLRSMLDMRIHTFSHPITIST